jgi:hypothetical protein
MKKPLLMLVVVLLTASLTGIAYSQETKTQLTPEQRAQKNNRLDEDYLEIDRCPGSASTGYKSVPAQKTEEIKNGTADQNQKMSALKTDNEAKEKEIKESTDS